MTATPFDTDVLIVGGGGCGLSLSLFLADYGISFRCIERNAETTDHPRAHILNTRTMEIFRQHGLADAVYAEGAPTRFMEKISFRTSLGGDGPLDRKVIGDLDGYGGGSLQPRYEADSACPATNLPLMQLEPLLRDFADQRAAGSLHFHRELIDFEQDADGVTATIRNHDSGRDERMRARYLVAADGGKTVGRQLGIEMIGPRKLRRMINTYFAADLSPYIDDATLIYYFINPELRGQWAGGGLVKTGPTRWDRNSETWVLFREVSPDEEETADVVALADRIRSLLKLPASLRIDIRKVGHWDVGGVHAAAYRRGRVFIAGDAAHRHPPVSALGLNTAIGDAHNLAWKLALVLKGQAGPALLDTYESERKPVGARVAEWALNGFRTRALLDVAIGLTPGDGSGNRAAFERLYADTPAGATARAIVAEVMRIQRIGPQAHDMEIGYMYEQGALVPDDTPPPSRDPMGSIYTPSTRPGSRLPHIVIGDRSCHDYVAPGRFTLFTADAASARNALTVAGIAPNVVLFDAGALPEGPNGDAFRFLGPYGAMLVRPDGHVAWRTLQRTSGDDLSRVMRGVLRLSSHGSS